MIHVSKRIGLVLLLILLGGVVAAGCLGGGSEGTSATSSSMASSPAASSTISTAPTTTSSSYPSTTTSSAFTTTTQTTTTTTTTTTASTPSPIPEEQEYKVIYLTTSSGSCPAGKLPVEFVYDPGNETVKRVSLRGTFNDWSQWLMHKKPDGKWVLTICLAPGAYQYKFYVDGEWIKDMSQVDPTADGYVDDGHGGKNAVKIVGGTSSLTVEHNPADPAYLSVADNRTVVRFKVNPGVVDSAVLVTTLGNFTMEKQVWWDSGEVWRAELPVASFDYHFVLNVNDTEFMVFNSSESPELHFDGVDRFPQIEWVSRAIGYQIFPDRFFNGNHSNDIFALNHDELVYNELTNEKPILSNWSDPITPLHCCHQYFGGDIAGITEKLDYLSSLGVKLIYLNPIFLSGSVHGYDTYDYYQLDPKFGTEAELRTFLDEAHRRGIKVIFDFVPDHTGIGAEQFLDVWKNGRNSPYWDWYFVKQWPFKLGDGSAYEGWWGLGSLPKLNTTNPEVKEYLMGAAMKWLDFGFDGIRVDTPADLPNSDEFFREFRERIKAEHPDAYLVGEIWDLSPEWVKGDKFDSLMNYALGRDILLPYAAGVFSGKTALNLLGKYYASYGENVVAMGFNLVDSHDTSRVLTDLGGGKLGDEPKPEAMRRLKLLSTLLYTLPGMPVTFQGDECGFLGDKSHYDEHRYPLQWEECNMDLVEHYRSLGRLREGLPALTSSKISFYTAKEGVIAFFRGHENEVLVIANNKDSATSIDLPTGTWKEVWPGDGSYEGSIEVPPVSVIVLQRS
ncbi:alpha-amylase family glycosyl hydrolase [Thermococcus guaymasensis]|uniref:alpha-amylase family glycosyl hydrolase n=1 Tax=Thermococcus guaymasensis TaxID=110164 RepID=UPI001FDEA681|nr:alpha-amylase family glycosyl hydrolase [Thermococcus guaymasensis]